MIDKAQLTITDDLSVGNWIRDALDPWESSPFSLGIVVPSGFDAYVLVRHKGLGDGHGQLGSATLSALLGTLASFTSTPEDCFHALWEGQGWMHRGSFAFLVPHQPSKLAWLNKWGPIRFVKWNFEFRRRRRRGTSISDLPSNTLPKGIMDSPRFELPNRDYLLMHGPLREALHIGFVINDHFHLQSPNLVWPRDKSWVLVTEIGFPATLIGGSIELVQAIMQNRDLVTENFSRSNNSVELGFHDF